MTAHAKIIVPEKDGYCVSELPNGIRIATHYMPHSNGVAVNIGVGVGTRNENEKEHGISHFIEHMLFRRTKNRTDKEINFGFERMGIKPNAQTDMTTTLFNAATSHPDKVSKIVEIFADMIKNSTFDKAKMKVEKDIVEHERRMYSDDPQAKTDEILHDKFYPNGHSIGWAILGKQRTVRSFTQAQCLAYYKKHYRCDNIVISAAGNIKHEDFVKIAEKQFGDMVRPETPHKDVKYFDIENYRGGNTSRKRPGLDQVQIAMGLLLDIPRCADIQGVLDIYTEVLCSGFTSRLFQSVREERGLTYDISANSGSHKELSELVINTATTRDKAKELVRVTCEEIAKMGKGITKEEFLNAKEKLKERIGLNATKFENISESICEDILKEGSYTIPNELDIDKITIKDVNVVAAEVARVASSKLSIATLGDDKKKILPRKQLQEIVAEGTKTGTRSEAIHRGDSSGKGAQR